MVQMLTSHLRLTLILLWSTMQALAKNGVLGKTEGIAEQLVLATEVEVCSFVDALEPRG